MSSISGSNISGSNNSASINAGSKDTHGPIYSLVILGILGVVGSVLFLGGLIYFDLFKPLSAKPMHYTIAAAIGAVSLLAVIIGNSHRLNAGIIMIAIAAIGIVALQPARIADGFLSAQQPSEDDDAQHQDQTSIDGPLVYDADTAPDVQWVGGKFSPRPLDVSAGQEGPVAYFDLELVEERTMIAVDAFAEGDPIDPAIIVYKKEGKTNALKRAVAKDDDGGWGDLGARVISNFPKGEYVVEVQLREAAASEQQLEIVFENWTPGDGMASAEVLELDQPSNGSLSRDHRFHWLQFDLKQLDDPDETCFAVDIRATTEDSAVILAFLHSTLNGQDGQTRRPADNLIVSANNRRKTKQEESTGTILIAPVAEIIERITTKSDDSGVVQLLLFGNNFEDAEYEATLLQKRLNKERACTREDFLTTDV